MTDLTHRLTTAQMASFVADGLLILPDAVPDAINQAALANMQAGPSADGARGGRLYACWPDEPGLGAMLRLPRVRGAIESLLGPDPIYEHHRAHALPPAGETADSPARPAATRFWRNEAPLFDDGRFDIQLFYFPHDTPEPMGGPLLLPGSHLRRVHADEVARYQNFVNQMPVICKAGAVILVHHGLWRCPRPNRSDRTRQLFTLRLAPAGEQALHWDTSDLKEPGAMQPLGKNHGWYGVDDRLETVNRIKLWRQLTSNPGFDLGYWLSRLENMPTQPAAKA